MKRMEALGVRLLLEGDALRVSAPKGVLDASLRAELAAHKPALMSLLSDRAFGRLRRASREGRLPVSAAQQRLWFLDRVDRGNAAYSIVGAVRVRGSLHRPALEGAFEDLISRHEALRIRIGERDGAPWVEVTDEARPRFEVIDLSGESPRDSERSILRLANAMARQGFDLATGPLSKLTVIRLADDHHVLASSTHHIIFDGWSMSLVFNELFRFYQARVDGGAPPFAPLEFSVIDHAAWERGEIESHGFDASLAYWKQVLRDAPAVLELPADRQRPAKPSFRGGRLMRFVDPELISRVKARAQQQNATPFMALMACWQAVLYRYSGQEDILVGTPLANRDRSEFEGMIGCLINNIVLRGRVQGELTLGEFLEQIRNQALLAFEHGRVPFDLVVEHVNPPRSMSHAPIFQVLFTHLSFPVAIPPMAGLQLQAIELAPIASRFDLTCEMSVDHFGEHAHRQRVSYEYALDLFDESTVARLHGHFEQMLEAFADDTTQRIGDVALALAVEDASLLDPPTAPVADHGGLCVHHLLERTAAASPERVALVQGVGTVTFGELDRRANRLARLLQSRGVSPKDLVAFCLDRTSDIPMTMAAVLKSGAAYVPLDPTHPQDRLRYIIEDSGAACVVTLSRYASLFDATTTPLVVLDEAEELLGGMSDAPLSIGADPAGLAYVLYTSGSTGRPKGVEVEHRNVVAFLDAMACEPGLEPEDVLLAVTTPAFDISGLEIWLPLMQGARIVLASRADVIDGARLAELIRVHGVTVLQATPATWRLLLESGWSGHSNLKALCGGEAMPRDLAAALLGKVGELWNMYGPTETTIWSTISRVTDASMPIVIGRPIANTFVRVLDAKMRQVPVGVVGELCIGGAGVARGYHNRPELTAEKFVLVDARGRGQERLYRTGDLARFKSDGQLDFLGRRDHQVKVRGYRIELGEIEAVLGKHAGIGACVVVVREDAPGDQRLTAYVTLDGKIPFEAERAKATLRLHMPDYMIPAAFVVLDALPLTPNGKIDRNALPRPLPPAPASRSERPPDAMTSVQRRVAQLWREVLGTESIGLADNFFDRGGHSLLLVKLHARLKAEFSIDFPLVELFQRTTVSAQAERMTSSERSSDALDRARARAERLARA